jgi:hypothetical protein
MGADNVRVLLLLGQPEAGLIQRDSMLRLSPRVPKPWGIYLVSGWDRLLSSQGDPAIDLLIKSLPRARGHK